MTASAFLLGELRRSRSVAGMSQEDLGKAINYSASLVSAVENGQRPPTRDYVTSVDRTLNTGGIFERLLAGLASLDQTPVWFRDWLILESEASMLRCFEPLLVPGLLQTRDYATAVIAGAGLLDAAAVESHVSNRMKRQALLTKPQPPHLIVIIDEAALRRRVGSAAIMAAQCEHLLDSGSSPHIRIHVVPADAGPYAGLAGAFVLAKGRDFEAAHIDGPQAQIVDRGAVFDNLADRWEAIRGEALPRTRSAELIEEAMNSWRT